MKNSLAVVALGVVTGLAASAVADDRQKQSFRAELVGFNEVPAVSTTGRGEFRAHVDEGDASFTFELTYEGLTFDASQSHIHFGQHHTNGGISVWLCQSTVAPAPASVTARVVTCPLRATTAPITATITAQDVIGPAGQGISATEFAELLTAMRAGSAYANVHSGVAGTPPVGFPGGEIRGQLN